MCMIVQFEMRILSPLYTFLSLPFKVEGEVSGARASRLAKKRKEEQEEFEAKKSKIESDLRRSGISIGDKFGGTATDKYEGMYVL